MATEDLYFIWGLSVTDRRSIFVDNSLTLFKAESPISIVVVSQGDVLGYVNLSREQDEPREMCEAIERETSDAEKELDDFWEDVDDIHSLQKEVDRYGRSSILDA